MLAPRHLFQCWHGVAGRLQAARLIALFLDFDGTLARIKPRPDEVLLEGPVRHALAALARSPRFRIWIISGRRQNDVRARVRIPGVRYLGLQGWEGRARNGLSDSSRSALACISSWLGGLLADTAGISIEDKEYALALHYRDARECEVSRIRSMLDGVIKPFSDSLRVEAGRNVWEVIPRELEDKGAAVRHQLAACPASVAPVYVGDDRVDEAAFAALPAGVTVSVGGARTSLARFRLANVTQVRMFLYKLKAEFV
jgi:trehalose-phosphatase